MKFRSVAIVVLIVVAALCTVIADDTPSCTDISSHCFISNNVTLKQGVKELGYISLNEDASIHLSLAVNNCLNAASDTCAINVYILNSNEYNQLKSNSSRDFLQSGFNYFSGVTQSLSTDIYVSKKLDLYVLAQLPTSSNNPDQSVDVHYNITSSPPSTCSTTLFIAILILLLLSLPVLILLSLPSFSISNSISSSSSSLSSIFSSSSEIFYSQQKRLLKEKDDSKWFCAPSVSQGLRRPLPLFSRFFSRPHSSFLHFFLSNQPLLSLFSLVCLPPSSATIFSKRFSILNKVYMFFMSIFFRQSLLLFFLSFFYSPSSSPELSSPISSFSSFLHFFPLTLLTLVLEIIFYSSLLLFHHIKDSKTILKSSDDAHNINNNGGSIGDEIPSEVDNRNLVGSLKRNVVRNERVVALGIGMIGVIGVGIVGIAFGLWDCEKMEKWFVGGGMVEVEKMVVGGIGMWIWYWFVNSFGGGMAVENPWTGGDSQEEEQGVIG